MIELLVCRPTVQVDAVPSDAAVASPSPSNMNSTPATAPIAAAPATHSAPAALAAVPVAAALAARLSSLPRALLALPLLVPLLVPLVHSKLPFPCNLWWRLTFHPIRLRKIYLPNDLFR